MAFPEVIWVQSPEVARIILKDMENAVSGSVPPDHFQIRTPINVDDKIEFSYISLTEMAMFRRVNLKRSNNAWSGFNRITYNQLKQLLIRATMSG